MTDQQGLLSFETICYRRVKRVRGQPSDETRIYWKKREDYGTQL